MTPAEMQYAIDRKGYLYIPSGTHTIDTPIVIGRSSRDVVIEGHPLGVVESSGLTQQGIFEFDWSGPHDPPGVSFFNVSFDESPTGVSAFKVKSNGTAPKFLEFEKCKFSGGATYQINGRSVGQSEGVRIRDCRSTGNAVLRWKTSTPGTYVTDYVNVENFRMVNSFRRGPAIDLDSCNGVRLIQVIDDGRPSLTAALVGVFEGPIALRINNPGPLALVDDYWLEPWGDWSTDAPNCFAHEFRADDTSSIKPQRIICRNMSMLANGLSGELIRIVGGHTSSASQPLRVDIESNFKLSASDILLAGKSYTVTNKTWYTDGGTTYPALRDKVNALVSDSFRGNVVTASKLRPPSPVSGSGSTYPGTTLDTNFFATAPDFEDLIA